MRNIADAKAQADSKGVRTDKQWSEDRQEGDRQTVRSWYRQTIRKGGQIDNHREERLTIRMGTGRLSGVDTDRQTGGEER